MKKGKITKVLIIITLVFAIFSCFNVEVAYAYPYYEGKEITLRGSFYTSYGSSKEERKHNIALACKSINKTFIDVNEEFSFNKVVGRRTEKRGYKKAVIISNGSFIEGVGGGVCQVSTTLYNAVLLSGLKVTEFHPHSLPVGYVAPSFDAMVNSGSADLRFINNTRMPIIVVASADGSRLKVEIYGEPMREKYLRKSIITSEIPAPPEIIEEIENEEYPELEIGEQKVITYSKKGIKSEGILIKTINGKMVSKKRIRKDTYRPQTGKIIVRKEIKAKEEVIEQNVVG